MNQLSYLFFVLLTASIVGCAQEKPASKDDRHEPTREQEIAAEELQCEILLGAAQKREKFPRIDDPRSEAQKSIDAILDSAQLGGCDMRPVPPGTPDPKDESDEVAALYKDAIDFARKTDPVVERCVAAIGVARARALVAQCVQVSGATHPPCNQANPCSRIVQEIDRSCPAETGGKSYPNVCAGAQ